MFGRGCNNCKKKTYIEFESDAKKVHGDKYIYHHDYIKSHTKIRITCPIHGDFYQKPNSHLNGCGCPKCANIGSWTQDEYISEVQKIHDFKYDYSKTNFIGAKNKIKIICPIHGEFLQSPYNHLHGHGCPKCANNIKFTTKDFIKQANIVHKGKYIYTETEYINSSSKVCITCPIHGEFWQIANDHLRGCGCPKCNNSKLEKIILELLKENNISYISQYRDKFLGKKSLDFYLIDYKIGIECQGKQHFLKECQFGKDENEFDIIHYRDSQKKQLCEEHDIKLLYYSDIKGYDTFLGEPLIKDTETLLNKINEIKDEQINADIERLLSEE